jgi:hypothetical protein
MLANTAQYIKVTYKLSNTKKRFYLKYTDALQYDILPSDKTSDRVMHPLTLMKSSIKCFDNIFGLLRKIKFEL